MAVYTDSFTGVDGTDLPDHDAAWTDAGDARPFEIQSNEVTRVTPGGNFSAAFYNQTFNSKHYAKLKITAARFIGPGIRMATGKNYYYCNGAITGFGFKTYPGQYVAGTATDWDAGQALVGDNSVLELRVDATTEGTIYYYDDGVLVATYTGKTALTGGRPGITCYGVDDPTGDDWEGGDVAAGAAPVWPLPGLVMSQAVGRAATY